MGTWAGTITHESPTAASGSSLLMLYSKMACLLVCQHYGQSAAEAGVTNAHPVSYDNNVGYKTRVLLIITPQWDAFAGVCDVKWPPACLEGELEGRWLSLHVDLPAYQGLMRTSSLRWKGEMTLLPLTFATPWNPAHWTFEYMLYWQAD